MSLRRLVRRLRFAKRANETQTFAKRPPAPSPSEAKFFAREARVVFAVLSLSATTAFAIQAWMTFGFAKEVWGMPVELCFALVFALDVFAVMWMILSYLLRGTGWPRFVAFVVFLFAIGAQVLAAEMFGAHRGWSEEVRWFSAVPALLLALSQEGVILWSTHRGQRGDAAPAATERTAPAPAQPAPSTPNVAPVPAPAKPAPTRELAKVAATPRKGNSNKPDHDDIARRVLAGQLSYEDAMREGNVGSKRAVQLWVKAYRERYPEPATPQLSPFPLPTPTAPAQPVNGAARAEVN